MAKRRQFTPEFKTRLVLDILTGVQSQAEACRKHALGPNLLGLWKATLGKTQQRYVKFRDGSRKLAETALAQPFGLFFVVSDDTRSRRSQRCARKG